MKLNSILLILLIPCKSLTHYEGPPILNIKNEEPFLAAVREGNFPATMYYLHMKRYNPNQCMLSGFTGELVLPMCVAAQEGHLEIIKFLIEEGGDVDFYLDDGRTPLILAAQQGHLNIVKYLIEERGANLSHLRADGASALLLAAQCGRIKVVQYLFSKKGTDIHIAHRSGITALHLAAQNGHCEIVIFLVEMGADVNCQCINGLTPLFLAAQQGHQKIVEFLVHRGADSNLTRTKDKVSPLLIASQQNHTEIVRFLSSSMAIPILKSLSYSNRMKHFENKTLQSENNIVDLDDETTPLLVSFKKKSREKMGFLRK